MKIIKLEEKISKNGGTYLSLLLEDGTPKGRKASCFSDFLFTELKAAAHDGIEIEISLEQKGDFWNVVGIAGVTPPERPRNNKSSEIKQMSEEKKKDIEKNIDRREESIRQAAIYRDAALFASVCHEGFDGEKKTDMLKNAHAHWLSYFGNL